MSIMIAWFCLLTISAQYIMELYSLNSKDCQRGIISGWNGREFDPWLLSVEKWDCEGGNRLLSPWVLEGELLSAKQDPAPDRQLPAHLLCPRLMRNWISSSLQQLHNSRWLLSGPRNSPLINQSIDLCGYGLSERSEDEFMLSLNSRVPW